jgi:hypothetical protein
MGEAQKEPERKGVASFKGAEGVGASDQDQFVVTIDKPLRRIVAVDRIDKAGKRQELAEEEWAKLVGDDEVEDIEVALEEAFEAGIAAALGEEYDDDEADENDDERTLRRFLIRELLRRRTVQRRILQRVLVSRLLRRQFLKRPTHQ